MHYKSSKEEKLKTELFKNPTKEYRAAPFWAWNCELKTDVLKEQIEYFKDMGFGGFFMHSRSGMSTKYLSEEFAEIVKTCVDEAEKKDMLAWLYDEDRWPSGAAGGFVTKNPEYRVRYLSLSEEPEESVSYDEAVATGKSYLIACYDIIFDRNNEMIEYRVIGSDESSNGKKIYAYVKTENESGWYNNQTYLDTLNPDAVKEFMKLTYGFYKKTVGDKFNDTVPAIFTDEPQHSYRILLKKSDCLSKAKLPWTMKLPVYFEEKYGFDIVTKIPELFWQSIDQEMSRARYCFYDCIAELFASSYTKQLGTWCKENNLKLTGHLIAENTLDGQSTYGGEMMRSYKNMQIPGIDLLCNGIELNSVKQCQSVVRQYGKDGMLSELYGVTNWDFDFRGHKFQGDWQAALGVTLRVPHLAWVSMGGEAKRDYPASIGYQSPWFKEYSYIENHFARVNTALTRGKAVCRVAVIHPLESYWIHCGPDEQTKEMRDYRELLHKELTEWLLFGLIDFDFVSESLLPELFKNEDDYFCVGEMKYDVVLIPSLETIRSSTLSALKDYRNNGGRIVFLGQIPKYIDAKESKEVALFADKCEKTSFNKVSILRILEPYRTLDIVDSDGVRSNNLVYNMRQDNEEKWIFVAEAESPITPQNTWSDVTINRYTMPISKKRNLSIKLFGEYKVTVYDTLSGEVKDIPYVVNNGCTIVDWDKHKHDSLLLNLSEKTCDKFEEEKKNIDKEKIRVSSLAEYKRDEPNVLLLDRAEFSLNDEEYADEEDLLKIDNICREKLGFPLRTAEYAQPWTVEKEITTHRVNLRFIIESKAKIKGVKLAVENADNVIVNLNGKEVENNVVGFYVDYAIGTIELPEIVKGKNILVISVPIGTRIGIENCFLLGEFNVYLKGRCPILEPIEETAIGWGDITRQGMPFYGGNLEYVFPFVVKQEGLVNIRVNHFAGALVKVFVDDKEIGNVVFDPYVITTDVLEKGEHTCKIKVFGNRYNTFGGLHNLTSNLLVGPMYWRTEDDEWSYEYSKIKETGVLSAPYMELLRG